MALVKQKNIHFFRDYFFQRKLIDIFIAKNKFSYMKMIRAHYEIIRKFVSKVSDQIESESWMIFAAELEKYIPGIKSVPVSSRDCDIYSGSFM